MSILFVATQADLPLKSLSALVALVIRTLAVHVSHMHCVCALHPKRLAALTADQTIIAFGSVAKLDTAIVCTLAEMACMT